MKLLDKLYYKYLVLYYKVVHYKRNKAYKLASMSLDHKVKEFQKQNPQPKQRNYFQERASYWQQRLQQEQTNKD